MPYAYVLVDVVYHPTVYKKQKHTTHQSKDIQQISRAMALNQEFWLQQKRREAAW